MAKCDLFTWKANFSNNFSVFLTGSGAGVEASGMSGRGDGVKGARRGKAMRGLCCVTVVTVLRSNTFIFHRLS